MSFKSGTRILEEALHHVHRPLSLHIHIRKPYPSIKYIRFHFPRTPLSNSTISYQLNSHKQQAPCQRRMCIEILCIERVITSRVAVTASWRANLIVSAPLADLVFDLVAGTVDEPDELVGGDYMLLGVVEPDWLARNLAYIV